MKIKTKLPISVTISVNCCLLLRLVLRNMAMTCEYLSRLYIRFLDLLKWAYFPRSGLPQVFHGVRNLVPNLRVLPFFLAILGGEGTKGPLHRRIRREILWEVLLFPLPPPPPLDIHDLNAAGNWKESEQAWKNYSIAMNLHQKPEAVHTASSIACPNRTEARKVFATFTNWASDTDQNKIQPVL